MARSPASLRHRDRSLLEDITEQLSIVRLDQRCWLAPILPSIHELLELETVGLYSVRNPLGRWEIAGWKARGLLADAELLARKLFENAPDFPLYYNPLTPLPGHRNRVIEAIGWIEKTLPGTWERSPICTDVLRPLGLHRHRHTRVLLCNGPALLGWFGGLDLDPPTKRQVHLMSLLIEPMRRRLDVELRLRGAVSARAALDVALERLGAPVFVLGKHGTIREANDAGRALLATDRSAIIGALRDAVAGRCSSIDVELLSLDRGEGWLAIVSNGSEEARIAACIDQSRRRWSLTPRQTEVLALVARGLPNATIASLLQCVERTVELHVTAVLDRVGVENRATLVARVLMSAN